MTGRQTGSAAPLRRRFKGVAPQRETSPRFPSPRRTTRRERSPSTGALISRKRERGKSHSHSHMPRTRFCLGLNRFSSQVYSGKGLKLSTYQLEKRQAGVSPGEKSAQATRSGSDFSPWQRILLTICVTGVWCVFFPFFFLLRACDGVFRATACCCSGIETRRVERSHLIPSSFRSGSCSWLTDRSTSRAASFLARRVLV